MTQSPAPSSAGHVHLVFEAAVRQADSFLRRSAQWQFTSSPKSQYWRYKFTWKGEQIRESTKQTNKRVAEQMEAALAKGEVGIREKKPVPTLKEFGARDLLPS